MKNHAEFYRKISDKAYCKLTNKMFEDIENRILMASSCGQYYISVLANEVNEEVIDSLKVCGFTVYSNTHNTQVTIDWS